jgi:hypothetical protein
VHHSWLRVRLSLLSTAEGGKTKPIFSDYAIAARTFSTTRTSHAAAFNFRGRSPQSRRRLLP